MAAPFRYSLLVLVLLLTAAMPRFGFAQAEKTPPKKEEQPEAPQVDASLSAKLASQQATLRTFIEANNEYRSADAIACLDLDDTTATRGQSFAYKLKQIIDRMWRIDYTVVSDYPDEEEPFILSEYADGLTGPDIDDAKKIQIHRIDGLWKFSKETVAEIDDLWVKWEDRAKVKGLQASRARMTFDVWLESQFPKNLREKKFLLPHYQWICLLVLAFLGFLGDMLTRVFLRYLTSAWFKYMGDKEQTKTKRKTWRPVGLLMQASIWYGGTTLIGLPPFAMSILLPALKFFTVVAGVWTAFRLIDLMSGYLAKKALGTETKFDDLLVPMVSRSLKVFAVCIGVLTCAQAFSLPIAGLLGGLGLGGMAFAFAAKDTVANLFGSVTVLVDRPFEIGDWIVTDGVEGTVETVGFRSTRVRTFYNSLVTLPNSLLTTASVDNLGKRRFRRVKAVLGVQYDTTPEQIDAFCEGIRELICRHPYTRKDYYHVYFNAFNDSSLDIMLYCFLECPDWSVELREKHRLFNDILRLAQGLGVSFAFPTLTMHAFQEQHGTTGPPTDLSDPSRAGQGLAAKIAGPLLPPGKRPGLVTFGEAASSLGGDEGE